MVFGMKKTRSSRASQHAAASPEHDSHPHPTHTHSQSSSQSNSMAERGNGRHQPRDRDEQHDIDSRWKQLMNDYIDGVLVSTVLTDAQKYDALKLAYDIFVSRIDNGQQ
ncbi:hypothetical protein BZA70DRAFT_266060 [Myxozyma melibiosi]|uniref:Uncharacterized protein n=1 Tax=Myxozyma melibiosi TaxID=54550 RepID=A0ABR1F9V2_9ASCO